VFDSQKQITEGLAAGNSPERIILDLGTRGLQVLSLDPISKMEYALHVRVERAKPKPPESKISRTRKILHAIRQAIQALFAR